MTTQALTPIDLPPTDIAPARLFGGGTAADAVRQASEVADALRSVLERQKLYKTISGRNHILVEGWTLLGTLVGVFPRVVWSRPLPDGTGYEARVEAVTMAGAVVGAAEAQCQNDEQNWRDRPAFALRSMAQTRATSKAMRVPLGFVVTLAGYDATPAEEMDGIKPERADERNQTQTNVRPMTQREAIPAQARMVDNPDDGNPEKRPALPATAPQIKAIFAIAKGAQQMSEFEVRARCRDTYGVEPESLDRRQASEFIDAIKGHGGQ